VVDLGRQIVPPQRDAEQELHPGHDPVAIADTEVGLRQMQLKAANVSAVAVSGERLRNAAKRLQL
jgi:hypothetical protein